ncbi:hypothetical protein [Nocardia abscessus]|uniref:hypothetical protein n=1 Tax=Nocardia abscessus TaxID=120957 RepID=UPI002455AC8B|nr:hypothetical protein [Nocardia abscessus]
MTRSGFRALHHACGPQRQPRARALAVLASEYASAITKGGGRPTRSFDALDRRLADLIRRYLCVIEERRNG